MGEGDGTSDAVLLLLMHLHRFVSDSISCMTSQLLLDISPNNPNSTASTHVIFPISNGMISLDDIVPLPQILHCAEVGTAVMVGSAVMVGKNVVVGSTVVVVGCTVDGAVTAAGVGGVTVVLVVGVGGVIVMVGATALTLLGVMVGESKVTPPPPPSIGVGTATTPGVGTLAVGADTVGDDAVGASGICIVGN